MTNLDSTTELTEFTPLSPENKQSNVTSIFSKIFKFSQNNGNFAENYDSRNNKSNLLHSVRPSDKKETSSDSNYLVVGLNPLAYKDTDLKKYWMPDSVSKECYNCGEKFTTFRRRHHCRLCGQIFCSQCSSQEIPGKLIGYSGSLRVCTYCCKVVLSNLQSSDKETNLSDELKALQNDLQSKFNNDSLIQNKCEDFSKESNINKEKIVESKQRRLSVVYQEEKFATAGSKINADLDWKEGTGNEQLETSTLNMLIRELMHGENSLPVQTIVVQGCKYDSCFRGSHLVDWLISQGKATSRMHSLAICQVLLDVNYIESVNESLIDFVDGSTVYKFSLASQVVEEKKENSSFKQISSLSESSSPFSHNSFHLDLDIHKNTVQISRNPQKFSVATDKRKSESRFYDDFIDDTVSEFVDKYAKTSLPDLVYCNAANKNNLSDKNNEVSTYNSLSDAFQQHLQNAVNQLLALENLSLSWAPIIVQLADQALNEIKIDFSKTNTTNISDYVQIKKVSGGERKDCCLVKGIVFSKNVAHKEMCIRLVNPRILLLQCAIVYGRVEGKLLSLEPVMMQEQEYLRHAVARIAALKPDIVLVHRNVSRLAQESLNNLGITLVLNVKISVLERIALCTNADILTSIDAHIRTTQLGTCRSFNVKEFILENGMSKTLMFFEGCAFPQLGCTLLLRGASHTELKKLKNVTNCILFMNYNAKLEKSFLLDEFAKLPVVPTFTFIEETMSPKRGVSSPTNNSISLNGSVKENNNDKNDCDLSKIEISRKTVLEDKRVSTKMVVSENDPLHLNTNEENTDTLSKKTNHQSTDDLPFTEEPQKQNKFRTALQDTVLSYSPFIVFNIPYLETKSGRECELRKYFSNNIYYSVYLNVTKDSSSNLMTSGSCQVAKAVELNHDKKKSGHPVIYLQLKEEATSENIQSLMASYRACGGHCLPLDKRDELLIQKQHNAPMRAKNIDVLDPRNHQRLSILFCSFSQYSNNAPEYCVSPWIVNMNFYGCNDIPLGSFLEKYCFRTSYMCPSETCKTSMVEHERRFVHNTGCILVTLHEIDSLSSTINDPILIWSRCTICKVITPFSAMSNDTWNLSFAKYLELRFHAGKYTCRADTACSHSLHHDYCQYFYHNNIVASFKYLDILLWELSIPTLVIKICHVKNEISDAIEQVKKWAVTGHEVYSSILEKLCLLDINDVSIVQGLKKHLMKQQALFKQKVDDTQILLTSIEQDKDNNEVCKIVREFEDSFVMMKRLVAEALYSWNPLLSKLDSQKREDKLKTRSFSSDIIENIPIDFDTSFEENINSVKEVKEELNTTDKNDNQLLLGLVNDFIEINRNNSTNSNQLLHMSSSSEPANSSATQTPDKISVKAIISQLLPNTFQNNTPILQNPINLEEHYLLNVSCYIPIVVYESEPSSIIAYSLSTYAYQRSLEDIVKNINATNEHAKVPVLKKEGTEGSLSVSGNNNTNPQFVDNSDDLQKTETFDETKLKSIKTSIMDHIEVSFSDSTANFTVKVYFAQQFKELRNLVFPAGEDTYIRSLSRCVHWAAHGGKSGSSFCKTKDDRFILKEMPKPEIQPFLEFAPNYFHFIRNCYNSCQPTFLVKIVGVYRVKYRNTVTNQNFQSNLLVMENLFYMRDISRKFDLKGSVRNRLVNTTTIHEGELVLLDENLINMTCESPLYIYPHSKTVLMSALNQDASFLASHCVMDYSLLVGLDETSQELVVGIIDYIRTFTWDKKIETMVKKSGILGGQGKLPTIVSPDEYKDRFLAAMQKYFLAVPDQWSGFGEGIKY